MKVIPPMSAEQFHNLIDTVKFLSLHKCPAKVDPQLDPDDVEETITNVQTNKAIEGINDADALKDLSLPLYDSAKGEKWYKGKRRARKKKTPPYQIYMEIFESKQQPDVPIDTFVSQKRALLAKLPDDLHDEATELNFVYGLLSSKYREHIPRNKVRTFRDLLQKGRNLERTTE